MPATEPSNVNERWETIVSTAVEPFATYPPQKVTMRLVAKTAGVSIGTLLHYFPTRKHLEESCYERFYSEADSLFVELSGAFQDNKSPEETLELLVRRGFPLMRRFRFHQIQRRQLLAQGRVEEAYQMSPMLKSMMDAGALYLASFGLPIEEGRLLIQGVQQLGARFAFAPIDELRLWLGNDKLVEEEILTKVTNFLVRTTKVMVLGTLASVGRPGLAS